jgi:hypothetical protein
MITIASFEENEDGSANCTMIMSDEDRTALLNYAILHMLTDAVQEGNDAKPNAALSDADSIVISSIKEQLVLTYLHAADIYEKGYAANLRQACKTVLKHYMIPTEAAKYIEQLEAIHEQS